MAFRNVLVDGDVYCNAEAEGGDECWLGGGEDVVEKSTLLKRSVRACAPQDDMEIQPF